MIKFIANLQLCLLCGMEVYVYSYVLCSSSYSQLKMIS